jgi:hypothetical protein
VEMQTLNEWFKHQFFAAWKQIKNLKKVILIKQSGMQVQPKEVYTT